ncbi:MAG: lipid-A-disaccharide synthase, partial [Arenicella sp.]
MKIGIVAGETSGDYLGSELIKAFKVRYPDAEFVGLAGPLMKQQGAVSLAEMDKISIMGIAGALKGVFEIFSIRKKIQDYMFQWRPDVFIGIDVPDFNLRLEINLKQAGIPTVHYVSPTVWAWRGKRITKIKRAIDLMLTLFPFEEVFYQQRNTPVKYVGHPLAKQVLSWHVSDDARKAI